MHAQLFFGTEYVENIRRVCGREVIGIWTRLRREQRRQSERRMETSCLENRADPYIVSKLSVAQKHKQHSFRSSPPHRPHRRFVHWALIHHGRVSLPQPSLYNPQYHPPQQARLSVRYFSHMTFFLTLPPPTLCIFYSISIWFSQSRLGLHFS